MKKLTLIIALCFAVLNSTSSFAQQSTSLQKITLKQAIDLALKNNFQIKQAQNNLERSKYAEKSALFDLFPDLNASLNYSQTRGTQFNQFANPPSFQDQFVENASGNIRTSVTLFDGLRNINALRASQKTVISQQEQLNRAKEDLIFNVATQFLTILLDRQLLDIANQNLVSQNKQLEQVKAQVQVGSRPVADLYNQESILAQNELSVIQRENTLTNDKLRLVRSLQVDPSLEYEFITPEFNDQFNYKEYSVNELVSNALSLRSDLKAQNASIEAAYLNYKISTGAHYPTLSFSAGYSTNYAFVEVGGISANRPSFSDQFFDQNINNNLGFSLQIPIFNRFSIQNNVQAAKVQYKNAQLQLDNLKLGVAQEVRQAYSDYLSYAKQLESSDKALLSAKKAQETQQERYKIGSSTLIELTQSNALFVEASSNRAQALFRLIFQEQLINYYVGKISADFKLN